MKSEAQCPKCNKWNPNMHKYCYECGEKLLSELFEEVDKRKCIDCERMMDIKKLKRRSAMSLKDNYICKKEFKKECIDYRYENNPPSEMSKEEAIRRFV